MTFRSLNDWSVLYWNESDRIFWFPRQTARSFLSCDEKIRSWYLVSWLCLTLCVWLVSSVMSDIDFSCNRPVLTQIAYAHLALSVLLPLCSALPLSHKHAVPLVPSQCIFIIFHSPLPFSFASSLSICPLAPSAFLSFLSQSWFCSLWCLLFKVTFAEQSLCCILKDRERQHTPGSEWNTLNWKYLSNNRLDDCSSSNAQRWQVFEQSETRYNFTPGAAKTHWD